MCKFTVHRDPNVWLRSHAGLGEFGSHDTQTTSLHSCRGTGWGSHPPPAHCTAACWTPPCNPLWRCVRLRVTWISCPVLPMWGLVSCSGHTSKQKYTSLYVPAYIANHFTHQGAKNFTKDIPVLIPASKSSPVKIRTAFGESSEGSSSVLISRPPIILFTYAFRSSCALWPWYLSIYKITRFAIIDITLHPKPIVAATTLYSLWECQFVAYLFPIFNPK